MSKIDEILKDSFHEDGTILILRDKYIGIRGCMELATKEALKTVKQLILPGNQIADEGLEALAESPYLKNLELLNANHNEIGDDGAIAIANTESLPNLKDLSMFCLLYTSPSPRDGLLSRMPSSA